MTKCFRIIKYFQSKGLKLLLFLCNLTVNGKLGRAIGIFSHPLIIGQSLISVHCFVVRGKHLNSVYLLFNSCGQAEIWLGISCALELSTTLFTKPQMDLAFDTWFLSSPIDERESATLMSSSG